MSFLQDVVDILLQYVVKSFDRSTKVIDFHYPNELLQEYNWELADQPQTLEEILLNCRTTLKYAIKTGNSPAHFLPRSVSSMLKGVISFYLETLKLEAATVFCQFQPISSRDRNRFPK